MRCHSIINKKEEIPSCQQCLVSTTAKENNVIWKLSSREVKQELIWLWDLSQRKNPPTQWPLACDTSEFHVRLQWLQKFFLGKNTPKEDYKLKLLPSFCISKWQLVQCNESMSQVHLIGEEGRGGEAGMRRKGKSTNSDSPDIIQSISDTLSYLGPIASWGILAVIPILWMRTKLNTEKG